MKKKRRKAKEGIDFKKSRRERKLEGNKLTMNQKNNKEGFPASACLANVCISLHV